MGQSRLSWCCCLASARYTNWIAHINYVIWFASSFYQTMESSVLRAALCTQWLVRVYWYNDTLASKTVLRLNVQWWLSLLVVFLFPGAKKCAASGPVQCCQSCRWTEHCFVLLWLQLACGKCSVRCKQSCMSKPQTFRVQSTCVGWIKHTLSAHNVACNCVKDVHTFRLCRFSFCSWMRAILFLSWIKS